MLAMWWRRRKQPQRAANDSDAGLRAELVAACADVRRQIDVQNAVRFSRGGGHGGDDLAVQTLQNRLDQLEAALASLDGR
ncbi:hypothetical protein QH494_27460 [Sphingomonas sp. AR_OL41]|jgi:hypothetical protein|uniref:hypothetical protein n=1 Tax=Sphingomonas sp. AR_OL41 TaxID=3042729 RepID=UPI0024806CD3|nr:hypothetical protein [Sphingomonas sp. AR_OL41]MDH7975934.1 hypothetical protein [Sphingomonas sp. AR_OL41]